MIPNLGRRSEETVVGYGQSLNGAGLALAIRSDALLILYIPMPELHDLTY